jgi:hypothetical protein
MLGNETAFPKENWERIQTTNMMGQWRTETADKDGRGVPE